MIAILRPPSGRFFKDGADILAKPVSALCILSISQGAFPSPCKVEKLKPIFKKVRKLIHQTPDQFPYFSQIIEKVAHDRTNAFLSDENTLSNYQSGFRGNHSTKICFSFLTDRTLKGLAKVC